MRPTAAVTAFGQHLWLDNLSRSLLREGTLAAHIAERDITGLTSNPAIFQNAFASSPYYADDLARLRREEPDPERRYEALAVDDIRAACDLLRPAWEHAAGRDGYASLEVSPALAHDAEGTVSAARRLAGRVDRPNLLIKVPGTPAGLQAFSTLTAEGVNVNVTLLFSLGQVEACFRAYLQGLERRRAAGGELRRNFAVASLFMSRVDTLVDARLAELGTPAALALRGKAALTLARLAYRRYQDIFHGSEFAPHATAGAAPQYLLWASTGVKNPDYDPLLYVEPLVGPETVNTLPDKTLALLAERGVAARTLDAGMDAAAGDFAALGKLGIDMEAVGAQLQTDGLAAFQSAFEALLKAVE